MTAADWVRHLDLQPHPEGGFFRETYRSAETFVPKGFEGQRNYCTAIYFLITKGNFSALHRIKSDETWHFYGGDPLEVIEISPEGQLIRTNIGNNPLKGETPQYTVPAGHWFGSRVLGDGDYSLVGCTVAPGFDFADFEMAERDSLLSTFPNHQEYILALTRLPNN